MSNLQQVECPKCSGKGHIEAFGHYAQGVCFGCNGSGTLTVDLDVSKAKLSADTVKKADFIMNATEDTFEGDYWTYEKLNAIDQFTCNAYMAKGFREVYPGLRAHWCENGRQAFVRAQEERLAAWYAENGPNV